MSSSERVRRRQEQRKKGKGGSSGGSPWFIVAIVVIVALFAAAFFLTKGEDEPSAGNGNGDTEIQETGPVDVEGDSLPVFESPAGDEAVGVKAPVLSGETFEGDPIEIGASGRPTVVLFLAHWCSHCQAEVPVVQTFIDEGQMPEGVDIVSVATGTDDTQANYPPSEWLEREGWEPEVMVDEADGTAADAYGLSAFPYFVFLNADGTVSARLTGEVDMGTFAELLANLQ